MQNTMICPVCKFVRQRAGTEDKRGREKLVGKMVELQCHANKLVLVFPVLVRKRKREIKMGDVEEKDTTCITVRLILIVCSHLYPLASFGII